MAGLMETYEQLTQDEKLSVEAVLDELEICLGVTLAKDDRAARAAEGLARYIVESRA